jgi:hypothetical protein
MVAHHYFVVFGDQIFDTHPEVGIFSWTSDGPAARFILALSFQADAA